MSSDLRRRLERLERGKRKPSPRKRRRTEVRDLPAGEEVEILTGKGVVVLTREEVQLVERMKSTVTAKDGEKGPANRFVTDPKKAPPPVTLSFVAPRETKRRTSRSTSSKLRISSRVRNRYFSPGRSPGMQ